MSRRLVLRLVSAFAVIGGLAYLLKHSSHPLSHYRTYTRDLLGDHTAEGQHSWSAEGATTRVEESILNLETDELPPTTYDGGLAGYTVWSNLYLNSGTFLALKSSTPVEAPNGADAEEWLETKYIMSSEKRGVGAGEDRWRIVDLPQGGTGKQDSIEVLRGELGTRILVLKGNTYIFHDVPGPAGYLVYFKHFLTEVFLGGARAIASTLPPGASVVPSRIWFPRCGANPSWRDDKKDNAWFLAHAMPFAQVEDALGFEDRASSGMTVLLEKVVIVDRWAAHLVGGEVGKWNKMNTLVPSLPAHNGFWKPFRLNLQRTLGLDGPSRVGQLGLPVVIYIDRQQNKPKVSDKDHDELVEGLKTLTHLAEIHVARLDGMTRLQQIDLLSRAEIVVGIHSDYTQGAIWLKLSRRSAVIELFEEGGFVRDWQLLARSLGHRHVVVQGRHILTEEEWKETGGSKRGPGHETEISVDAETVVGVLRDILQA